MQTLKFKTTQNAFVLFWPSKMEEKLELHSRGKKNESQLSNGISDTLISRQRVLAGKGVKNWGDV